MLRRADKYVGVIPWILAFALRLALTSVVCWRCLYYTACAMFYPVQYATHVEQIYIARLCRFHERHRLLFCSLLLCSSTRGTSTLFRFSCGKRITRSVFAWPCLWAWSSVSTCSLRLPYLLRCFRWGRWSASAGIRHSATSNSVALPIQAYQQAFRTYYIIEDAHVCMCCWNVLRE